MSDNAFKYEIVEQLALISTQGRYTFELNRVRFRDQPSTLDLRKWGHKDGEKYPGKGVTVTDRELHFLRETLDKLGY